MVRKTGVQINTNPYGQDIKQGFKDVIIIQIFTCNNALNTFMNNPLGTMNVIETFEDLIVSYFSANDIFIVRENGEDRDTSKRKYRPRILKDLYDLKESKEKLLQRVRRNPTLLMSSLVVKNEYREYIHSLYTELLKIIQSGGLLSIKQELVDEA